MQYNDYIIAVDENGQPYIAHASGWANRWKNVKTKYIEKFPNLYRSGKTAYAYTQQQAEAMRRYARGLGKKAKGAAKKAWGSKLGRFIDEHDAGVSERLMSKYYQGKAKRAGKRKDTVAGLAYTEKASRLRREAASEKERAKRTISEGTKRASNAVKNYGGKTLSSIRSAGSKVVRFVDDHDAGLTERIQANRQNRKARRAKDTNEARIRNEAANRLRKQANEEWESSRIGKAGKKVGEAARTAGTKVNGVVQNAKTKAGENVNATTTKAKNWAKELGTKASNTQVAKAFNEAMTVISSTANEGRKQAAFMALAAKAELSAKRYYNAKSSEKNKYLDEFNAGQQALRQAGLQLNNPEFAQNVYNKIYRN